VIDIYNGKQSEKQYVNGFKLNKMVILLGIILIGSIVFSNAVSATNSLANTPQPKFHHDNNNTGQSQYTGPSTNTTKWKYQTGAEVRSSPAIGSDGTVYIGSRDSHLYAINPSGSLKWKYKTGNWIESSPAIGSDGTVYVGSGDGYLYAVNPSGSLKWRYQTGNWIGSSPAIGSDGTVYVGSDDNYFYAINPSGSLKWRYQTGGIMESSPAIGSDGTVYVGNDDGYLYAINPNGSLKWRYQTERWIDTSPAIGSDGTVYVGSVFSCLYAVNPNGSLKWRYQTGSDIDNSPAIGSDGTVYVGSGDCCLYAINPSGSLKWKYKTGGIMESSPAIGSDGTVYVGNSDGCLYGINPTGTLKWRYQTGKWIGSSPAIGSDGTVYVGSMDNYLYAISDITVSASQSGGQYTGSKQVTLSTNLPGTIYYEIYNSNSNTGWIQYKSPLTIKNSCNLAFYAVDSNGNTSPIKTESYTLNYPSPTVSANIPSGLYNKVQAVILTTNSDIYTTTYYTTDGSDPQTSNTRQIYTGPITISNTIVLRFSAIDSLGSWSPEYTENLIIDMTSPTIINNLNGGTYNTNQTVTLKTADPDSIYTTYYTTDGTDPQTSGSRLIYALPISVNNSMTLRYMAVDPAGNWSPEYLKVYSIIPTVTSNPIGGLYKTTKTVTLGMKGNGNIYYTLNGTTPTNMSIIYTKPITINNSAVLKYIAIDNFGNISPVGTQTYNIDKTPPKIVSTTPVNKAVNVSLTNPIKIKFSENIIAGINYTKIYLKNIKTGKLVSISITSSGNTLTIKHSPLSKNTNYKIYIPASSVKDKAGNSLKTNYSANFRTKLK
jgi:outer membrane protein assembly factor BamB